MTTDTFHRFSKMELEEQFLDVLGHLGSFGDPEDEFSVHPLDELSGERQMLSDSAEDTGTMRLRASPARTAEVVDAAGSTVDLDFLQDNSCFHRRRGDRVGSKILCRSWSIRQSTPLR